MTARSVPSLAAAAAASVLSGCGIAHELVLVPEMDVHTRPATAERVEVVCSKYHADAGVFAAIVTDRLAAGDRSYSWARAQLGTRVSCPVESRYIGYPFVPFLSYRPSDEAMRERHVFLRREGGRTLYRVRVKGRSATIESVDLDRVREEAHIEWREIDARQAYYDALRWAPAADMRAESVENCCSGGVASVVLVLDGKSEDRR